MPSLREAVKAYFGPRKEKHVSASMHACDGCPGCEEDDVLRKAIDAALDEGEAPRILLVMCHDLYKVCPGGHHYHTTEQQEKPPAAAGHCEGCNGAVTRTSAVEILNKGVRCPGIQAAQTPLISFRCPHDEAHRVSRTCLSCDACWLRVGERMREVIGENIAAQPAGETVAGWIMTYCECSGGHATEDETCWLHEQVGCTGNQTRADVLMSSQPAVSEEGYPSDWARVVLMVSPKGEMHAIGGDREPGEGDTPYIGLERINARIRCPDHSRGGPHSRACSHLRREGK
jgi:hypothetical protein